MKKAAEWDIYTFSQEGIEAKYLQPYPRRNPKNRELIVQEKEVDFIKDGQIERALHGGMHVGRASLLVLVLNYLLQQCFPQYAAESVRVVSAALNIAPGLLKDLTRAAVIYHDSARENEGMDLWDKESAKALHAALMAFGFNIEICDFLEAAAANKDAPQQFAKYCQAKMPDWIFRALITCEN